MSDAVIRIATRASRLVRWQARHVAGLLESAEPGVVVELVEDRVDHVGHAISGHFDRFRAFERFDRTVGRGQLTMQDCGVSGHSIVDVLFVLGRLFDAVTAEQFGDLAHGYEFHLKFSVPWGGCP